MTMIEYLKLREMTGPTGVEYMMHLITLSAFNSSMYFLFPLENPQSTKQNQAEDNSH